MKKPNLDTEKSTLHPKTKKFRGVQVFTCLQRGGGGAARGGLGGVCALRGEVGVSAGAGGRDDTAVSGSRAVSSVRGRGEGY